LSYLLLFSDVLMVAVHDQYCVHSARTLRKALNRRLQYTVSFIIAKPHTWAGRRFEVKTQVSRRLSLPFGSCCIGHINGDGLLPRREQHPTLLFLKENGFLVAFCTKQIGWSACSSWDTIPISGSSGEFVGEMRTRGRTNGSRNRIGGAGSVAGPKTPAADHSGVSRAIASSESVRIHTGRS
jgi:hypothetical protein